MPPNDTPLVYVARPTLRLNGAEDERMASLLTHMVMSEQEGGLSSLELRLSNSASLASGAAEYAFDAGGDLDFGKELVVGAGDALSPIEIFRGLITGIEGVFDHDGPPELIVLAEDALQKFRCQRRSRTFEDQSLADIAQVIANDHALTPSIDGLTENFGPQVQLNETDLGFLRRLLARVDGDVQIVGTELHVAPRAQVRRSELTLALGRELKRARVLADLAHQITKSTVKGWDVANGQPLNAEGRDNALGPGAGRKGADAFRDAIGERAHHTHDLASFNQDEVDAVATTVRNRRARRFLRVEGETTGSPAMRVGSHATLSGLGAWFSNTYYITSVRHRFDPTHGYRTEFEGQCAFLGES
ncbi:phage late control D family protein [Horticoccus sp. 23ND18S-11]|uniref:phage late control D family protein n=1 Tax=Horticoccus sp. 23ND18S-11 TaxID=3391832 RepID=UPI0039C98AA5